MQPLSSNPASAYRRVEIDARVEASSGEELTLICLEEAVAALGQALVAIDRAPGEVPHGPLARAHGIALWLARSIAPDNPLRGPLLQFYGGLAAAIAQNRSRVSVEHLAQVRGDFADLLGAAKAV